jgi:hypothetical protein
VLVSADAAAFRYDDLWTVDLRVSRAFRLGRARAVLDADALNVLDSDAALVRVRNVTDGGGGVVRTLSARLFRLGLRLSF